MDFNPVVLASILPAVITGAIGILTWNQRFVLRARLFSLLMFAVSIWSATEAAIFSSTSLSSMNFWLSVQYLSTPTIPVLWLLVVLRYTGAGEHVTARNISLLLILPLIALFLVWTNDVHHLFFSQTAIDYSGQFPRHSLTHGPLFWVLMVYSYSLMSISLIRLITGLMHKQRIYRAQAAILLAALLLVILTNVVYISRLFETNIDIPSISFMLASLTVAIGIVKYQTLDLVPVARDHVFENMVDGVVVVDSSDRLIDYNRSATRFFQHAKPDIGEPLTSLWNERKELPTSFPADHPVSLVEISQDSEGATGHYQVSVVYMDTMNPTTSGKIIILHDITARKQAEINLQAAFEKEKELRQSLEEETQKRIEFTRTLVHELKTPLTPIIASSDLLASELKEEPWATIAGNIFRGAEGLSRRIDELLDLAKSEVGKLQVFPKPTEPARLLTQIVSEMSQAAAKRGQTLKLELPDTTPVIMADEDRLRQVVNNLVNNAFKFSSSGSTITVRAHSDGDFCIFQVEDTGKGLTKEQQSRLFQPYERLDADRQRFPGLGLGLALCKTLVELQGGRIWVESEPGKGSTFRFSLPVYKA